MTEQFEFLDLKKIFLGRFMKISFLFPKSLLVTQ